MPNVVTMNFISIWLISDSQRQKGHNILDVTCVVHERLSDYLVTMTVTATLRRDDE